MITRRGLLLLLVLVFASCGSDPIGVGDMGAEDTARPRDVARDVPTEILPDTGAEDLTGEGEPDGELDGAEDPWTPEVTDSQVDLDGECGYGNLEGRICAPAENVWISGAQVTIDTEDCGGAPAHYETLSDGEGRFLLEGVPSGWQHIVVERGSFRTELDTLILANTTVSVGVDDKLCFDSDAAHLAVVRGQYDSIEAILDLLGLEYDLFDGATWYMETYSVSDAAFMADLLLNPSALGGYDVLFLNCGEYFMDIQFEGQWNTVITNLRGFVRGGGSIYASDWAYPFIEGAYGEAIDFHGDDGDEWSVLSGDAPLDISATITDTGLATHLGWTTTTMHFPDQGWSVIDGVAPSTAVIIQGDAWAEGSSVPESPLLVSFQPESSDARVVFTAFHNHQQLGANIQQILYYLVFML